MRIAAGHCGRKIVARRIVPAGRIVPEATAEDILGQDWRGGPSIETSAGRHRWWAAGAAAAPGRRAAANLIVCR